MKKIFAKGFSIVEVLVIIAIMAVITAYVFNAFFDTKSRQSIEKQTAIAVSVLERARSMTLASENDYGYGVRIGTNQMIIFRGSVYDSATTTNKVETISLPLLITDIAINGGGVDVIFKRLTGETDEYGSFVVMNPQSGASSTITVYATGVVETTE